MDRRCFSFVFITHVCLCTCLSKPVFYFRFVCIRILTTFFVCFFVCLLLVFCLFVCLSHSRIFHPFETSPLPVKAFPFWPLLGTHGHWAVRVLNVPHVLGHGATLYDGHLRGPLKPYLLSSVWHWSCHYLF